MSTPTTRPTIVTPTMNPALDITTDGIVKLSNQARI